MTMTEHGPEALPSTVNIGPRWEALKGAAVQDGVTFQALVLGTGQLPSHRHANPNRGIPEYARDLLRRAGHCVGQFVSPVVAASAEIGDALGQVFNPDEATDDHDQFQQTIANVTMFIRDAFPEREEGRDPEIQPLSDVLVDASNRAGILERKIRNLITTYTQNVAPFLLPAFALHATGEQREEIESFFEKIRDNPDGFTFAPSEIIGLYVDCVDLRTTLATSLADLAFNANGINALDSRISSNSETMREHEANRARLQATMDDIETTIQLSATIKDDPALVLGVVIEVNDDGSVSEANQALHQAQEDDPFQCISEDEVADMYGQVAEIRTAVFELTQEIRALGVDVKLDTINLEILRIAAGKLGLSTRNKLVPRLEGLEQRYKTTNDAIQAMLKTAAAGLSDGAVLLGVASKAEHDPSAALAMIGDGENLDPLALIAIAVPPTADGK